MSNRDGWRPLAGYGPWQSIGDTTGRYGYQPSGMPPSAGYADYLGSNPRGGFYAPGALTVPLGVRGMTDRPDYDWRWYGNSYDRSTGRNYYTPPDGEQMWRGRGVPPFRRWAY